MLPSSLTPIHTAAALGFSASVAAYERGRPSYPEASLEWLLSAMRLNSHSVLIDLAAGTGKMTALLEASGARVIAVEPVAAMRERLQEKLPQIEVLEGRAECMPLGDESVDAICVAQAFHWFDGEAALAEIHRVLKPGGCLSLIWNSRDEDESDSWGAEITRIIAPWEKGTPRSRTGEWRRAFDRTELFAPLEAARFDYEHELTPEALVDRVLSISFIAALPSADRVQVEQEVRELIASHPQTRDRESLRVRYRTEAYACQAILASGSAKLRAR